MPEYRTILLIIAYSLIYYQLFRAGELTGWPLWRAGILVLLVFCLLLLPFLNLFSILWLIVFVGILLLVKRFTPWMRSDVGLTPLLFSQMIFAILLLVTHRFFLLPDAHVHWPHFWSAIQSFTSLQSTYLKTAGVHLIGISWILWGGTIFVRSILNPFTQAPAAIPGEEYQRGKIIGNLERVLIYLFMLTNSLTLITLIVGLKAIARFKKLEERPFAEYFLIGTLSSLLWAFLVSIIIRSMVT